MMRLSDVEPRSCANSCQNLTSFHLVFTKAVRSSSVGLFDASLGEAAGLVGEEDAACGIASCGVTEVVVEFEVSWLGVMSLLSLLMLALDVDIERVVVVVVDVREEGFEARSFKVDDGGS